MAKSGKVITIIAHEWLATLKDIADVALVTNLGITLFKLDRQKMTMKEVTTISSTITYCWFEVKEDELRKICISYLLAHG